jgi:hypothetical protein
MPSQFAEMNRYEKAFIIASIDIKIETEKKEQAKLKKAGKK